MLHAILPLLVLHSIRHPVYVARCGCFSQACHPLFLLYTPADVTYRVPLHTLISAGECAFVLYQVDGAAISEPRSRSSRIMHVIRRPPIASAYTLTTA